MSQTIYYHADCLDGFGAAYAAWRVFGDAALYRPVHHGEAWQPEDVAGRNVHILDFAFAPEDLRAMAALANSVTVLDHHVTARQPWQASLLGAPDGSERHSEGHLHLHFDMQRSGARLAWENFHPEQPLPLALAHVEDIDLWRFAVPETRAFCRALRMLPWDFAAWDAVVRDAGTALDGPYQRLLGEGRAIEKFFDLEVQRLADSRLLTAITLKGEPLDALQATRHGLPTVSDGTACWRAVSGVAINANGLFASELGNLLAERHGGFALIWELTGAGLVKASLRACGAVNVAQVAENYGGGGHANAAGFRLPVADFLPLLSAR